MCLLGNPSCSLLCSVHERMQKHQEHRLGATSKFKQVGEFTTKEASKDEWLLRTEEFPVSEVFLFFFFIKALEMILILPAMLTFSLSAIWLMIDFSRVPFVPQPDSSEGPGLDFHILSFCDSKRSFPAQPSSGLGGVAVGYWRGAELLIQVLAISLSYPGLLRMGKKSWIEFMNLDAWILSVLLLFGGTLTGLGYKVIGISTISFHIVLHVVSLIRMEENK